MILAIWLIRFMGFNKKAVGCQSVECWPDPLVGILLFRKQVEDFLVHSGPKIWGKAFDAAGAVKHFHQKAGIELKKKTDQ